MIFRKEGQRAMLILDSAPKRMPYEVQLKQAVEREDYERAAVLRDRIKAITASRRQG